MVSYVECQALKETTDLVQVICPDSVSLEVPTITISKITLNGNYPDNPFMWDYLTLSQIKEPVDIAFFNGAPFTASAKMAKKVIVDVPAHDLEKSIEEFNRLGIEYPYKHMTDPFLWQLYTEFIRQADLIVCPSKISAEYVKQNPGTKARVEAVYHGTDIPKEVKPIPSEFKVGYLGAAGPDKGLIYLVKAWAGLMYKDAELLLAGMDDTPPYKEMLSRTIYQATGHITDVSDFYNKLSVYVQPSVTEAFGIPALEAMAHCRPVIVSEGAGISELVQDGVEGYVVPIRDASAIAERIDYLKSHRNKVEEMGRKARLKAEKYPWSKAKDEFAKYITEL